MLELTGILNENEFYTGYYFCTILPDHLKATQTALKKMRGVITRMSVMPSTEITTPEKRLALSSGILYGPCAQSLDYATSAPALHKDQSVRDISLPVHGEPFDIAVAAR